MNVSVKVSACQKHHYLHQLWRQAHRCNKSPSSSDQSDTRKATHRRSSATLRQCTTLPGTAQRTCRLSLGSSSCWVHWRLQDSPQREYSLWMRAEGRRVSALSVLLSARVTYTSCLGTRRAVNQKPVLVRDAIIAQDADTNTFVHQVVYDASHLRRRIIGRWIWMNMLV